MCIRDRLRTGRPGASAIEVAREILSAIGGLPGLAGAGAQAVSYTHLPAHETVLDLVCRLLLEKKKKDIKQKTTKNNIQHLTPSYTHKQVHYSHTH